MKRKLAILLTVAMGIASLAACGGDGDKTSGGEADKGQTSTSGGNEEATKDGKKVYAFSLFDDWDGDYMAVASKYAFLYGYDEGKAGFVFPSPDATSYSEISDENGVYHNSLKMLFDAKLYIKLT